MTPFVRFVFTILAVGLIVNLAIVVLANERSSRRQSRDLERERQAYEDMVAAAAGRVRRADIAVEWQKIAATGEALETSLLVREYLQIDSSPDHRFPVKRVIIPGGELTIDGVILAFDSFFAEDREDFRILRDKKVFFFSSARGVGQKKEDGYEFMPVWGPPRMARLHPEEDVASYFEMRLWNYIWDLIFFPERARKHGLSITRTEPVRRMVRQGRVYQAYVGLGGVSLEEDSSGTALSEMLNDAATADRIIILEKQ